MQKKLKDQAEILGVLKSAQEKVDPVQVDAGTPQTPVPTPTQVQSGRVSLMVVPTAAPELTETTKGQALQPQAGVTHVRHALRPLKGKGAKPKKRVEEPAKPAGPGAPAGSTLSGRVKFADLTNQLEPGDCPKLDLDELLERHLRYSVEQLSALHARSSSLRGIWTVWAVCRPKHRTAEMECPSMG